MTYPVPRDGIAKIKPHMAALPKGFDDNIIKLASNESAFGPSPRVIETAQDATTSMHRYAEQGTFALQQTIANAFNLDADRIICGPGSDELLVRLTRAYLNPGDELIYSANGYAKFANYALANDAIPVMARDDNFRVDIDAILDRVSDKTKIVTIANPDNPTGTYVSGTEIRRLHHSLPGHVLLVLDSAYTEYVDQPDFEVASALVEESDNVVMTRTFSKIFGLAGLRLGWLYAPLQIAETMNRISMTFPISNIALACGIEAIKDNDYRNNIFERNQKLRNQLCDDVCSFGLEPVPSQTNFVLVRFPDKNRSASAANEFLWKNGIMVRRFPNPVFENYIRVSIGDETEMQRFTNTLNQFVRA